MALSVAQLLSAIRATPEGQTVPESLAAIGTRLLAVGRALVDTYAPLAPEDVRDEAVIRIAGYLYDAPNVTRSGVAWNESGAHALVDRWVQRGVAPVEFDLSAVVAAEPEEGGAVNEQAVEAIVRRILAEQPPSAPPSAIFERLGDFVFNASGTTSVDSGLTIPESGWIVLDFDGGRGFWVNAAELRTQAISTAGRHLTSGAIIVLPDANASTDFWIGRSADFKLLISNLDGTGSQGFTLYRVQTAAPASGGLTQAEVDARIAAVIPAQVDARIGARVEAWATQGSGDTPAARDLADNPQVGQVLKAASDGDAEWANETVRGLTQAQVDARVKAGVKDKAETGGGKWAYPDDYILPQGLEALNRAMAAGGWEARAGDLQISGPQARRRNANQATAASYSDSVQHGTSQTNWFVIVRVANALGNDPAKFRLNIDDDIYQSLMGVAEIANSANAMWYYFEVEIPRLPAASVVTAEYDEDVELGGNVDVAAANVKGTLSESRIAADRVDGLDARIDARAPRTAGLIEIHNAAMATPTLVDLSGHRYSVRQPTTFDLDDHPQGVFEFEVRVTLAGTSVPANLSFATDSLNRIATIEGLLTATALSASTAAANPAAGVGLVQGEVSIYSGIFPSDLLQGKVRFYIARDANNVIWCYMEYEGETTAVSGNGALTANLALYFQRSDTGLAAAAPVLSPLIGQDNVNISVRNTFVLTQIVLPADYATKRFKVRLGGEVTTMIMFYGGDLPRGRVGDTTTGSLRVSVNLGSAELGLNAPIDIYAFKIDSRRRLLMTSDNARADAMPLMVWEDL